ncbi:MAG: diacylglycerol kinase family protein [Blastocatellia bacterium]
MTDPMKAVVIINKGGGSFAKLPNDNQTNYLQDLFKAVNIEAKIHLVKGKKIISTAQKAAETKADVIVAGGGDGTISTVASTLIDKNIPLGILPLGTLNHFSKDLKIPQDLISAIKVISENYVFACDIGQVNSVTFINNSSIGLYPQLVQKRDSQRQKLGLGKWSAMLLAIFSTFFRVPSLQVSLEVDERIIKSDSPFVFVGNNMYKMNLLNLGTREQLDKGEICLYLANRGGRFGLVRLSLYALLGRLNQTKDFRIERAKEIWIETKKRRLRVALDGEVQRLYPPLHYTVLHKALKVIVPKPNNLGNKL